MPSLLSLPRVRFALRPRHGSGSAPPVESVPIDTVRAHLVLSRGEAERLSSALDRRARRATTPGDVTPDHLRRAITTRIADDGADASVEVVRLPAALTTPEAWDVRIEGIRPTTLADLESAAGRTHRPEVDDAD